jgi:hypothetical protein
MDIAELSERYREAAAGTGASDAATANMWHDVMHSCYKKLCTTTAGRAAIIALMSDVLPHVRCWAASHSLEWEPEIARTTLEALRDSGGACSFDAEMVLKEYAKGHLSFDY